MKVKLKKALFNRQIVLSLLVMLVIVAGIINWANENHENPAIPVAGGDIIEIESLMPLPEPQPTDYFAQARHDRDVSRSQAIELLESTRDESTVDDIRRISQNVQNEALIEGLIMSKGFENAIAYVGNDSANIIVQARGLTAAQVAQIRDIVITQTSLDANQIRIAEVGGE